MQPLQCAAVVKRPALGAAAAGPSRWVVGVAVLLLNGDFVEEEAALGNHSAQSPASSWVASPGHAMGRCKVKCSLYDLYQVWWSLCWGLGAGDVVEPALGAATGLGRWFCGGCGFADFWSFTVE